MYCFPGVYSCHACILVAYLKKVFCGQYILDQDACFVPYESFIIHFNTSKSLKCVSPIFCNLFVSFFFRIMECPTMNSYQLIKPYWLIIIQVALSPFFKNKKQFFSGTFLKIRALFRGRPKEIHHLISLPLFLKGKLLILPCIKLFCLPSLKLLGTSVSKLICFETILNTSLC